MRNLRNLEIAEIIRDERLSLIEQAKACGMYRVFKPYIITALKELKNHLEIDDFDIDYNIYIDGKFIFLEEYLWESELGEGRPSVPFYLVYPFEVYQEKMRREG